MTSPEPLWAAIYARVSTFDQEPENRLAELRKYVQARGNSPRGSAWPEIRLLAMSAASCRRSRSTSNSPSELC